MTWACDAEMAEGLGEPGGGLLLAGRVGRTCSGVERLRIRGSGSGELLLADGELEVELLAAVGAGRAGGRGGHDRLGERLGLGHRRLVGRQLVGGGVGDTLVLVRPRRAGDRDLGRGAEEVGVAQRAVERPGGGPRPHDRLLARGLGRPEVRRLVRRRLGPVVGLVAAALTPQHLGRLADPGVGRAQHAGDRRAGQQQHAGDGEKDRDDARADAREGGRGGVVERLARDPAVVAHGLAVRAEQQQRRAEKT